MTTKSGKVHKLKISKEKESRKIRQVGFTILNIDKKSTDKKIVIKESKEYKNVEFLNAVENISKPNFGLPEDIKVYSMAKDGEYIDILNWVKGHNMITKIKVYSMAEDGEYIDISNWVKGYSVITKIEVCAFLADQLPGTFLGARQLVRSLAWHFPLLGTSPWRQALCSCRDEC